MSSRGAPAFGVTSREDELDRLTITLEHLVDAFPESAVHVGLVGMRGAAAAAIGSKWPAIVVHESSSTGAARNSFCATAHPHPLVVLAPGSMIDDVAGLSAVLDDTAATPLVFGTTSHDDGAPPLVVKQGWHAPVLDSPARIASKAKGRLEGTGVASGSTGAVAADLGGADCIVDTAVVGPGRALEWDELMDDPGVCTADLAVRLSADPTRRAGAHGRLRFRHAPTPAPHLVETGAASSLHRFLDVHDLFEMTVDGSARDFLTTRRESMRGPQARALRPALGALQAHWRSPRTLATRWANLAAGASFGRHVASANPDELTANVFFGRDGSWAFVRAAGCGHRDVLRWVRGHELGVERDDIGHVRAGRLLSAADIGFAEAGELLARRETVVFTVVPDASRRLATAWLDTFGPDARPWPPAAALASYWRHHAGDGGTPSPLTFTSFLEAVASLPDHRRDRRWRRLTDALALGSLRYDAIVAHADAAGLLPRLGEAIGWETVRPIPQLGATASVPEADADLLRRACGPDPRWKTT